MTVGISNASKDAKWFPSAALAGSVLLKQRNSQFNATSVTLGTMLKTGCLQVQNSYRAYVISTDCLKVRVHISKRSIFSQILTICINYDPLPLALWYDLIHMYIL